LATKQQKTVELYKQMATEILDELHAMEVLAFKVVE